MLSGSAETQLIVGGRFYSKYEQSFQFVAVTKFLHRSRETKEIAKIEVVHFWGDTGYSASFDRNDLP